MSNLFTLAKLGEDIYHMQFKDALHMAATMMRFQEQYESPKFAGTYFTRDEFEEWYSAHANGASYAQDWAEGFNVPSSALKPFYEGHFDPLTADEQAILDAFADKKDQSFYIIATADDSDPSLLRHEIAHALYFLNPTYKKEVDRILNATDTTPIRTFLATHSYYGEYHESVLQDEIHAYFTHTGEELRQQGFDTAPYESAIQQLQTLYETYAPKARG